MKDTTAKAPHLAPLESLKDFVIVHLIFIGLCFAIILIPFPIGMGIKLLVLVAFYNLGIFFLGILRKNKMWIKLFVFTFLISVFQIWPDWFLSAQLNVLVFPEDGSFKIGTVSGYMVGLWTIPLFIICFIGGVLEEEYRKDMSIEEAKDLVKRSIQSAIERDPLSGNGMDLVVITKDKIEEISI